MRAWLIGLWFLALPAWAQVSAEQPWTRATPPGATVGAGFMVLKNAGPADRVLGASSPLAGRVEMHVTVREGDVMKMRQVQALELAAGGRLELKPGGAHLMLMNLKGPIRKGDKVPLTLKLEKGGELKLEMTAAEAGARAPAHKMQ